MKEYEFKHAMRDTGKPIEGSFACFADTIEEAIRIHDQFLKQHAPHLISYGEPVVITPQGVMRDMYDHIKTTIPRPSVCDYTPAYGGWDLH